MIREKLTKKNLPSFIITILVVFSIFLYAEDGNIFQALELMVIVILPFLVVLKITEWLIKLMYPEHREE